jgi:hypothetical protein
MLESLPAGGAAEREDDAVSPELVLVDPELARRERRALSVPRPVAPPTSRAASRAGRLRFLPPALILGCALALTALLVPAAAVRRAAEMAKVHPTPAPVGQPLRFSWAAVPGAHSYRFVVYRGGTRLYEALTTMPEQTVPVRWTLGERTFRLERGTYRWVVTPRLGASPPFREGKPIVDATYTA